MSRKRYKLPFDRRGGLITQRVQLIQSAEHSSLSPQSKVLMQLMHTHWRNDKPVDYGVREAQDKIPCGRKKAMEAFRELQTKGFIVMVDESLFNSRTHSKARTWRLTWLPYMDIEPTNDWEKKPAKIKTTGRLLTPLSKSLVSKVTPLKHYQEPQVLKATPQR